MKATESKGSTLARVFARLGSGGGHYLCRVDSKVVSGWECDWCVRWNADVPPAESRLTNIGVLVRVLLANWLETYDKPPKCSFNGTKGGALTRTQRGAGISTFSMALCLPAYRIYKIRWIRSAKTGATTQQTRRLWIKFASIRHTR